MRDPDLCAAELCELSTNIFLLNKPFWFTKVWFTLFMVHIIYGSHNFGSPVFNFFKQKYNGSKCSVPPPPSLLKLEPLNISITEITSTILFGKAKSINFTVNKKYIPKLLVRSHEIAIAI